jgi:solute carrier family 40 (iron-regulated transporter), member 1
MAGYTALKLYTSHALSTWNSRTFEFGAVLFLAMAAPNTLLYSSGYAFFRALSAVLMSSKIGSLLDRANRLSAIRLSIVLQRIPVALSCLLLLLLLRYPNRESPWFLIVLGCTTVLACVEKLAAVANTVAVERDWVLVVADSLDVERRILNVNMRRIDLFCKLSAPVLISFVQSYSTELAIVGMLSMNCASVLVEYFAIYQVYSSIPELATRYAPVEDLDLSGNQSASQMAGSKDGSRRRTCHYSVSGAFRPWISYIRSPVLLPSLALSLLYLTVLSTGVQYQTYMLSIGFSAFAVSFFRLAAGISEILATFLTPILMKRVGGIRTGLWSINWQLFCLFSGLGAFVSFPGNYKIMGAGLSGGIILSRLGLWGVDLAVQHIVQEVNCWRRRTFTGSNTQKGAPEHERGEFSATEAALQNSFEMLSFASTIVFADPDQFIIPVCVSLAAVSLSACFYAAFARKERGHLLHLSKCMEGVYRG